ncbi:substrate-binding domain-containing protein [Paenibacillus sp. LMG 31456]|uniref:Substrate-binding domain-containing protein n=1 Tax=Paenibacillus foliorum TaxID=2654974 RepID=A0A972K4E2_9BACL|nr:sugar-binding protein [Paenibacillus foliorum]NOU96863.1 substrate-binding domain-containing protein [Paenibacillus foliorum]
MSNRNWNQTLFIVFIIFACLLLQFLFTTLRIRELVRPLTSNSGENTSRHVVLISQELDNPYWRSIEQGAREASKQYGINMEYLGPFRINPAEQTKLLEKAIAAKADAVLVQGINDLNYRALIDKAADRGIPVITVDTDEPGSRRLSYVGTNNWEAGTNMGELVVQAAGKRGSIGVLVGNEQADNQRLRLAGFQSVINQYPELTIADVRSSNISRLQAARQAEEILSSHPQVGFMVGFSALDGVGIMEAVSHVKQREVSIFAFDDLAETKEGIRHCSIASTLVQQPYQMGYDAVSLIHGYFQGKNPETAQHFTPTSVLNRQKLTNGTGSNCQ